jgi:undecaprenyl-diphosphatase
MDRIIALDKELFWWINGHHSGWLDWTMWVFSQSFSWLVVLLAVFIFITLRRDRRSWLWVLAGLGLCFLLADQISNNVIKDGVQRLRPCYALENVRMFHTGRGGSYGFVSSHAANAFAVAMFLSFTYGGRKKIQGHSYPWMPYILMLWAVIVGYSRVYLGKHYPGDVVCGALLGLGLGAIVYFVISKIRSRISSKEAN